MTYRDVAGTLHHLGCRELLRRSNGSHRKWVNPATNQTTVLPDWGSKDLRFGTIRVAVRQLAIQRTTFSTA